MLYACDCKFWQAYFPDISRKFAGELWTVSDQARDRFDLHWIYGDTKMSGLSRSIERINCGSNSGYQAIQLAAHFGATRLLLLGYDFMRTGGRSHWHGDHPRNVGLGNGGRYAEWIIGMNALAKDLKDARITVLNCTRKSALRCFPQTTIEEALA